jgi:hypothetical protein
MAKQKVSDAIQKQFEKPQFQLGAAVFFSWMGYKQAGYVKKIKKATWGIQYTVEAATGIRYPCGIEIKGQKTHYNTGCIHAEETRSIGPEALGKRFQNEPKSRRAATISINTTGTTDESPSNDKLLGGDDAQDSGKATKPRAKRSSTKMDATSSTRGNSKSAATKRRNNKDTELDEAIQKQRSFLDFTKPIKKD